MPTLTLSRPPAPAWLRLCAALGALVLAGCTTVQLVSAYDENTDKGITEFQKSVATFMTGLERTGRKEGALTRDEAAFFQKAEVDLSVLQTRAAALPMNRQTTDMLANLAEYMATLEQLLPLGVTKEQVKPIHDSVNTAIGAILKLELAKKRGTPAN